MRHANVKLIHESVRENCPFPINDEATLDTCLWTFHKQFMNELDAKAQGYGLAICDRSVLDPFVYYHAVNPEHPYTHAALAQASEWLNTYDLILHMQPEGNMELFDDGFRATDAEYQNKINDGFGKILKNYGQSVRDKIFSVTSKDVFDLDRREKLIEVVTEKLEECVELVKN